MNHSVLYLENHHLAEETAQIHAARAAQEAEQAENAAKFHERVIGGPQHFRISRRFLIQVGGAAAGAAAVNPSLKSLLETSGQLIDTLESPEDILDEQLSPLVPRIDNSPAVKVGRLNYGTADVPVQFYNLLDMKNLTNSKKILQLNSTNLFAQHTDTAIQNNGFFVDDGEHVVTPAEGLKEQRYMKLFKQTPEDGGEPEVIGIDMDGGLFYFERKLGQKDGSKGEFVRVVVKDPTQPLATRAVIADGWKSVYQPPTTDVPKIVHTQAGADTLRAIGYQPYGIVLPTTRMPESKHITLGPNNCAKTVDDVIHRRAMYMVTAKDGVLLDINHGYAKASETFDAYMRLLAGSTEIYVPYTAGSSANYWYKVNSDSTSPENLDSTVFAIMNDVSVRMEGVSQASIDKLPLARKLAHIGDRDPEDMSTNALFSFEMIKEIAASGIAEKLRGPLQALRAKYAHEPTEKLFEEIDKILKPYKPHFTQRIMERVARTHGISEQTETTTLTLPEGHDPLVPTSTRSTSNMTRPFIDFRGTTIQPNNPKVRFRSLTTPSLEAVGGRIAFEFTRRFGKG